MADSYIEELSLKSLGTAADGGWVSYKALPSLKQCLRNTITAQAAANEILAILPPPIDKRPIPVVAVVYLGDFFMTMAEQISYNKPGQLKLVDIWQHLSTSANLGWMATTGSDWSKVRYTMECTEGFVQVHRRTLGFYNFEDDSDYNIVEADLPRKEDRYKNKRSQALNRCAFVARLTQRGLLDRESFTSDTLRHCLREPGTYEPERWIDDASYSMAALWMLFAGHMTYDLLVIVPVPGSVNGGLERWRLWKKMLVAVARRDTRGEECRRLAAAAVKAMDGIDASMELGCGYYF